MGTLHFLTKEQKIILGEIGQAEILRSQFYFTGGTALAAYYLNHRYSEDLDFFSQNQLENQIIATFVERWGEKHAFKIKSRFVEVVYIFELTFSDGAVLKVDFAHYPYKRIEKGQDIDNIQVDSLLDIAVNKLLTISQRTEVKDFVDLYFLLDKFSLWDLMSGVQIKFHREIDPFLLAADFLKVEDFTFLPRMIKPLTLEELKLFYRKKAKEIGKRATE